MNRFENTKDYVKDTINISCITLALLVVIKFFDTQSVKSESSIAQSLIEQAYKWFTLSTQDKIPSISFQHANFAMAYLNAARHVSSDTKLEQLSSIDVHNLYKKIDELQRQSAKLLIQKNINNNSLKKTQTFQKSTWLN